MRTAVSRLRQSETAFQSAVLRLAKIRGWRVAHFRKVRTFDRQGRPRWSTPVAADGAGFPDLVLARRGRVVFAELKAEDGSLEPEQRTWIAALETAGAKSAGALEVVVWRPRDWATIEQVLA